MLDLSKKYLKIDKNDLKKSDIMYLQKIIDYHSDLYYNKEEPIISDSEYDGLFKKLEYLENKYNISNKQTSLVGALILESTFKKVKHSRPMISLDNTYNEEDLEDFDERVKKNINLFQSSIMNEKEQEQSNSFILQKKEIVDEVNYCLEFKFDGLGIELIYKKGKLVQAITRGNGIEGEDVTQNIFGVDNIPKEISYKEHLEVRGEVVMPISSFNYLNEKAKKEGTKIFSNPRNAASGSVRMKDPSVTKQRKLKFFAYDLANFDDYINLYPILLEKTSPPTPLLRGEGSCNEYYNVIKSLENLGFEISSYFKKFNGIVEVINAINNFSNIKKEIDFEIDGLVLKVNNISLWEQIGWTEHHPRYAIAYKFPAEIFTTKIISVDHQVGRTGTITPVANLEPVNMGGAIIRRATLHNYEEVENLDVRIGDNVFIKRAGEVIPKIISVIPHPNPLPKGEGIASNNIRDSFEKIVPPEFCPSCGSGVKKDEDKVRYYCPNNIDCPAKYHEKLTFAVGKQGFNIDGFGEKQVELFLNLGIIKNLADIFKIKEKREDILSLEGFQEKSVNNLIESVKKAKKVEVATLITALGIPGVGKKTAKTISKLFESKDDILNFSYQLETLETLEDIGPEIAKNIMYYFTNEANKRLLYELIDVIDITYYQSKKVITNSIFYQKKMCITGSFISEDLKKIPRDDLIKELENVGGEFMSSVSKITDFLLAGEKAGSKLKKAKEYGVEIIDLTYFKNNI